MKSTLKNQAESILYHHRGLRNIYDYKVDVSPSINTLDLNISIKPNRALEYIQMNIVIKGDEVW